MGWGIMEKGKEGIVGEEGWKEREWVGDGEGKGRRRK